MPGVLPLLHLSFVTHGKTGRIQRVCLVTANPGPTNDRFYEGEIMG